MQENDEESDDSDDEFDPLKRECSHWCRQQLLIQAAVDGHSGGVMTGCGCIQKYTTVIMQYMNSMGL